MTKKGVDYDKLFVYLTDKLLEEVEETDLIFIPALSGDMKTAVEMNKDVIPWVVKHYKAFRDIFKRITGLTPIEYRNKYNRQVIMA